MKRFEYKITKHSADTFDKIIYFCSKSGQCGIDEVSRDQTRILRGKSYPTRINR
jgi:hypothetical protein